MMPEARFPALKREPLIEERLPDANPPVELVKGARIAFAPGQPSGKHSHPMSTCGVVTKGSFVYQREGDEPRVLKTGDAFFEPAGRTMLQFDNASATEPAEIVSFYLTDDPDQPSIEMLDGGMDAQLGKTGALYPKPPAVPPTARRDSTDQTTVVAMRRAITAPS